MTVAGDLVRGYRRATDRRGNGGSRVGEGKTRAAYETVTVFTSPPAALYPRWVPSKLAMEASETAGWAAMSPTNAPSESTITRVIPVRARPFTSRARLTR